MLSIRTMENFASKKVTFLYFCEAKTCLVVFWDEYKKKSGLLQNGQAFG